MRAGSSTVLKMKKNFSQKLEEKQKFHNEHEAFTERAYNTEGLLPDRYVFILTNLCNLKCSFCYQKRDHRNDVMTSDDWIDLAGQLPEYARVLLTGGEPLVFKEFRRVFSYVAERFSCNMITNGVLLTEDIIDYLLSFPNFKVLSLSIDDIGSKNRGFTSRQWEHVVKMMEYFRRRRDELGSTCTLDVKSLLLDENAKDIFKLHKYMVEQLGVDTHVFQLLKGSSIQHSDHMFDFDDILQRTPAPVYDNFDIIKDQIEKVRQYDLKEGKMSFLHPKIVSLVSEDPLDRMDLLNKKSFVKKDYSACKFPWSSAHINFDGTIFPCLAVSMGNVKETSLSKIINGEKISRFRNTLRKEGTVEACNRCGWLKFIGANTGTNESKK